MLNDSEDPTEATLPFLFASGALNTGFETGIFFTRDTVVLMQSANQPDCSLLSVLSQKGDITGIRVMLCLIDHETKSTNIKRTSN